MQPAFIPGLQLSELFYAEAVKPILKVEFPALRYSAALIAWGSDVLGYDTPQSTDHHWGPRLLLFLAEDDYEPYRTRVSDTLSAKLPYTVRGFSTNFGPPDEIGVRLPKAIDAGSVDHMIEIFTIRAFFTWYLGCDPYAELRPADWLTFSGHRLVAVTSGTVVRAGLGVLIPLRDKFRYYPRDVWLYLLAAQWQKISQEEAFVGRCGDVGDELGSRIIATRIVHSLMRLCFLMEQAYPPYPKWFGTAFSRLASAPALGPIFMQVLAAPSWKEREQQLAEAYRIVAEKHNSLDITEPIATAVSRYYGRPYLVIHAGRFSDAIMEAIGDEEIQRLRPPIGSVSQFIDSEDVSENVRLCHALKALYG